MIRIRAMTEADIPLGMRLTGQAGWNQTEGDWRRFLRAAPNGSFVAEWDGAAVGTAVVFGGTVCWLAMVLVDEAVRRHRLGTALVWHALAFLDRCGGRPTVRLDATPLGQPVYERLGFVPEYTVVRYGGVLPETSAPMSGVEPTGPANSLQRVADFFGVLRFDLEITRAMRVHLVKWIVLEEPAALRLVRDGNAPAGLRGYLSSRAGAKAIQIGPCLAADEEAGRLLLADAAARHAGQSVFIDVPAPNLAAVRAVEAFGLRPQRELLRMVRGEPVPERVEWLWASSGPEKG